MILNKKFAFTLAEVMITLTVIGIITAVIMPIAFQSKPDENVMKFKKGHNTLFQTISTLVNSEKYYKDGDMGIRADGTQILGGYNVNAENPIGTTQDIQYLCKSFADVVSTKSLNCSTAKTAHQDSTITCVVIGDVANDYIVTLSEAKNRFDTACKKTAASVGEEIKTTDNIIYYQANPQATFGILWLEKNKRLFDDSTATGFLDHYKVFCMDIDGIPSGVSESDCKNECPFGYGIRTDGKILPGTRANEWLKKDIQGE